MLYNLFQFNIYSAALWTWAWIFLIIGILGFLILLIYNKYGREVSIRLTVISVIIASVFLGFSIHFFLVSLGI